VRVLLIFLFALLLALLLDVKLWLLPLFFITFIFLSNVTHDDYSFLVGLSLQMTDTTFLCTVISSILPLVLHSVNNLSAHSIKLARIDGLANVAFLPVHSASRTPGALDQYFHMHLYF
jgi:hypothetical protein